MVNDCAFATLRSAAARMRIRDFTIRQVGESVRGNHSRICISAPMSATDRL